VIRVHPFVRPLAALLAFTVAVGVARPALAQPASVDDESDASGAADDDDLPPPPAIPPTVAIGLEVGTMYLREMSALNASLARSGLGEAPPVPVMVQPMLGMQIGRVMLPIRARFASSSGDSVSVETLGGTIGAGYVMLKRPDFVLFPSLSFGLMRTRITAGQSADARPPSTFDSLLHANGPVQMGRITVVAEASFDAAYRVVGKRPDARGLYLGVRVGVCAGLAESPWSLDHSGSERFQASDGPRAPVSGPLAALGLTLRL
jgi:hypothetical protein